MSGHVESSSISRSRSLQSLRLLLPRSGTSFTAHKSEPQTRYDGSRSCSYSRMAIVASIIRPMAREAVQDPHHTVPVPRPLNRVRAPRLPLSTGYSFPWPGFVGSAAKRTARAPSMDKFLRFCGRTCLAAGRLDCASSWIVGTCRNSHICVFELTECKIQNGRRPLNCRHNKLEDRHRGLCYIMYGSARSFHIKLHSPDAEPSSPPSSFLKGFSEVRGIVEKSRRFKIQAYSRPSLVETGYSAREVERPRMLLVGKRRSVTTRVDPVCLACPAKGSTQCTAVCLIDCTLSRMSICNILRTLPPESAASRDATHLTRLIIHAGKLSRS